MTKEEWEKQEEELKRAFIEGYAKGRKDLALEYSAALEKLSYLNRPLLPGIQVK
jgi:hypothetical protein